MMVFNQTDLSWIVEQQQKNLYLVTFSIRIQTFCVFLVAENDMRDEIDVWTLCLSVSVNPLTFLLR